tara:strand:+ start:8646 stop:10385 length:1740 start_codon:yes stop_codon:yes gene_type:complete
MSKKVIVEIEARTGGADKKLENVKKTTKEVGKEAKSAAGDFQIMGTSVNGLKGIFTKVGSIGKAMFSTLKMGIASTGIGILLIAFGALMQYFKDSEEGASKLKQITSALGVVFGNLTDIVSNSGKALFNLMSGNLKGFKEALKETTDGVKNFGETTRKEMGEAIQLEKDRLKMQKFERKASVDAAKTASDIMKLRLDARDVEKFTNAERLVFMREANKLADEQLAKDLKVAEEKLRFQQVENSFSKSTKENLDAEAQLQAAVFNIQRANFSERKRMKSEEQAIVKAAAAEEKAEIDAIAKAELEVVKKKNAILDELEIARAENEKEKEIVALEQKQEKAALEIEALVATEEQKQELLLASEESFNLKKADIDAKYRAKDKADRDKIEADKNKKRADDLKNEKALADSKMALAQGTLSLIQDVFGKESKAGKAAAIAQATINTYQGITAALASAPPPINIGLAAITGAAGFKSVADIVGTQEPKFARGGMVGGFGTGTSDSVSARLSKGETVINAKSSRMFKPMLSAMNEAGGGVGFADGGTLDTSSNGQTFGAIKAFVVTDDVTNSQNSLDKIRQKATI